MDQYNGCPVLKFQVVNEVCVLPKFVCVNLTYFTEQISLSHDNLSSHFSMLSFLPLSPTLRVFQMCNREGSEIVDAIMKVIGIKFKGRDGRITRSEYVRVNLVDFEHPFFSRVWHGERRSRSIR